MRLGIMLLGGGPSVSELLARIERAEEQGFQSIWLPNVRGADALTVLALAGGRTSRIELGTFVVPTYPRHPAALAQQALTTQVATGGRLVLGIGLSHRVTMADALGFDFDHPIRHMRDYLRTLGPLMTGEPVEYSGPEIRINGYQISVPGATPPPVLVAALGPQMLRLTGTLADGTAIWMGGARYLSEHAVPIITAAAREAGRSAPRIVAGLPLCVTANAAAARDFANQTYARYGQLPSYRAVLDKNDAALPADAALIGTAAEVRAGLDALASAGATDFAASVFAPPGEDTAATFALLREYAGQP
ncbi:MAG TPA: TIGR03564 family F420-dependent LLM class oxidoreductase, partial [Thermomicrobiales bacterium]|nr:TIGR03564 family F420-dependent LLM class oxidoreductase [Thermomicrobiales bacterium]